MIPRANFLSRYTDPLVEKIKARWSLGWRDALASAIAAALARAQAQRAAAQPRNTAPQSPEQAAEIAAIDARRRQSRPS